MKVAFVIDHEGVKCFATFEGKLIIATSISEVVNGPSRHVVELGEATISVTKWMEENGAGNA